VVTAAKVGRNRAIREARQGGVPVRDLAEQFGLTSNRVSQICTRTAEEHVELPLHLQPTLCTCEVPTPGRAGGLECAACRRRIDDGRAT
jgi:hypothetical protein